MARKREEESWAQRAANALPTIFTRHDETSKASHVNNLLAENTLQDRISTPQIKEPLHLGNAWQAEMPPPRLEETNPAHSAAHLPGRPHQEAPGEKAPQPGRLPDPKGLRFNFTHPRALSVQGRHHVDRLVSQWMRPFPPVRWIRPVPPVQAERLPRRLALAPGERHLFGETLENLGRSRTMGRSKASGGATRHHATGQGGLGQTEQMTSITGGVRPLEALTGDVAVAEPTGQNQITDVPAARRQTGPTSPTTRVDRLGQAPSATARKPRAQSGREAARMEADQATRAEADQAAAARADPLALAPTMASGIRVGAVKRLALADKTQRASDDLVRSRRGLAGPVRGALLAENSVARLVGVPPALTRWGSNAGQAEAAVGQPLGNTGEERPNPVQGDDQKAERLDGTDHLSLL